MPSKYFEVIVSFQTWNQQVVILSPQTKTQIKISYFSKTKLMQCYKWVIIHNSANLTPGTSLSPNSLFSFMLCTIAFKISVGFGDLETTSCSTSRGVW